MVIDMDICHKNQNVFDDILLKTGTVILTGVSDELGYHLVIFQSCQSTFIRLDWASLVQSIDNIVTYYHTPAISFLVNLRQSSQTYIEHFVEVIIHVKKTLLNCDLKRVYIVKPEQKSNHKTFVKELQKTKKMIGFQIVIVKNFEELHQHIKVKNLPPDFGGVLLHDLKAWMSVQKMLSDFYLLVDHINNSIHDILKKINSLTYGARPKDSNEHMLGKRLLKAEHKKEIVLRKCNMSKALKEGERFRSFFNDPSLNEAFYALSKTPLLEWDRVKFNKFYRQILSVKNDVDTSWKDGLNSLQVMSSEERLHDRLAECSTWIVDYGFPYLTRMSWQTSRLDTAHVHQRKSFENEFYKQGKDIVKKSQQALNEVHNYEQSFHIISPSLHAVAENLISLTDKFQEKLEEQMKQHKKQDAFLEVMKKAETWYKRAQEFWPSRLEPSSHWDNSHLSPSDFTDVSQSEYDLERFLERCPPLTTKELSTLTEDLDDVTDSELRKRARLLGNRCQEVERILRARETHLVDVSGEEWILELKRFDTLGVVIDDRQGTGNQNGRGESRLMSIQRRLRDQELLYEQLKIEEELRDEGTSSDESNVENSLKKRVECERRESGAKSHDHARSYVTARSDALSLSTSLSEKILTSENNTFYPKPCHNTEDTADATPVSGYRGYPRNIRGTTSLPGHEILRSDVEQQSVSSHVTSHDDIQGKLRIARDAEKDWVRIKNEQRARLGHVIHDVKKRKEIEEVYFNAQVQLCRVRREIAILNNHHPSSTSLGLSLKNDVIVPVGSSTNENNFNLAVPNSCSQAFPGQRGAFHAYVKDVDGKRDNEAGRHSRNDRKSQEVPGNIWKIKSDEKKDLASELGAGGSEHQGMLGNSVGVKKERRCAEVKPGIEVEKEEEMTDEFEDDEEDELLILRSDSSCGRRSQDELKDSLREEQEKLEEVFRQQKEQFKEEQEKLKKDEERIKKWEGGEQFKEGGNSEEVLAERNGHKVSEDTTSMEHQENKLEKREQQQQQQQQQHQAHSKLNAITSTVQKRNIKEDNELLLNDVLSKSSFIFNVTHDIDVESESSLSSDSSRSSEELDIEQVKDKLCVTESHPVSDNDVSDNDVNDNDVNDSDVNDSDVNDNDVSELEQISVAQVDTDDETRQEIEEELIKILKEGRSTDGEEVTDEEVEIEEEEKKEQEIEEEERKEEEIEEEEKKEEERKEEEKKEVEKKEEVKKEVEKKEEQPAILRPQLPDVGSNIEKVFKPSAGLNESDDIELLNHMIDDLMIQDESKERELNYVIGNRIEENALDKCERNGDEISRIDFVGDGMKFENEDVTLTDVLQCRKGDLEEPRTLGTEESLDSKGDVMRSRYTDESGGGNQRTHGILKDKGNHTHGILHVSLDNHYEDSTVVNGNNGDVHGVAGDNVDSLISRKLEDNTNNNSVVIGDNWDEKRIDDDDVAIDVDFNIVLTEDDGAFNEDLSLMDILRGKGQLTESEDSLDGDEGDMGTPDAQQDNEEDVGSSESHIKVDDELPVVTSGDISGDNGIPAEENQIPMNNMSGNSSGSREITVDTSRLQGIVRDNGSIGSTLVKLETEDDVQDVTVIARTIGKTRETHEIFGDNDEPESDLESDDDFGTVLEDIEEEGSEYEDLMSGRSTHVEKNNAQKVQHDVILDESSISALRCPRFTAENFDEKSVTNLSFSSSIIIDPGSGCCKAGFSIDDKPRIVLPSVVGKPRTQQATTGRFKDHYVGYDANRLHHVLTLQHPVQRGVVTDWDLMEKMLEFVYDELRCEADQYPVLLSESPLNPRKNREQIIQIMFETFQVPAAYTAVQAVLALFATGKTTGLVYDCGHDVSYSVPIYEGYAIPHATRSIDVAGQSLTHSLARMLRDRGSSLESSAELEIVQDMKEKLCYVVVDYARERKAYNTGERHDVPYKMPDGQTIMVGSERFRCPEVLFAPSIVGFDSDGIHEAIYKTVMQCGIDMRETLLKNIILAGGSTMFSGLPRRLHLEMSQLLGTRSPDCLHIEAAIDRSLLTWQGGAILSKLSNFSSMWITRQEYEELGPAVVHKKCV